MAKILMEDGEPPIDHTTGGSTFYLLGGRPMVRQRVTPIQPLTAAVRREVNAITNASRAWAWRLDALNRATWGLPCFWGSKGSPWFQAIWSILNWIWNDWGDVDFTGNCPDPICCDGLVVDVGAGSMLVSIAAGGTAGMLGYVSASPPMSPGRIPTLKDTRSLVVGIVAGTTIDVGAAYIARFGRLPTSGLVAIASRFGDLVTGSCTPICIEVFPIGGPGELTVTLDQTAITLSPLAPPQDVGAVWAQTVGSTTSCIWSFPGMTLATAVAVPNPSGAGGTVVTFTQVAPVDAVETIQIRATSQQESLFAQAPLEIVSSSM